MPILYGQCLKIKVKEGQYLAFYLLGSVGDPKRNTTHGVLAIQGKPNTQYRTSGVGPHPLREEVYSWDVALYVNPRGLVTCAADTVASTVDWVNAQVFYARQRGETRLAPNLRFLGSELSQSVIENLGPALLEMGIHQFVTDPAKPYRVFSDPRIERRAIGDPLEAAPSGQSRIKMSIEIMQVARRRALPLLESKYKERFPLLLGAEME